MTVSTPEQHEQRASHDASEGKHNVCQGRLAALADAAVSEKLGALPGWQLLDMRLNRAFQCTNFDQSIDFMNRVASIANDINHHPDIAVLDKRSVRVTAWTRKLGYLTDIDFDLAASVEAMYATEFADRPAR
ncbi:4a-hydroxytetrahydrobiopterin dehydratase [Mycobacterium tuberculosis]|uniref:4a-hydroxytetrahydrobiopterin dehydratase n=1 Tax=Mycobacterium tuberculosis TaxID=1773 RepID=UPI0008A9B650|nr:4a-hydroxytetrahydrobiopterin dehydratase [Mycobacterium tuberculosis]